MISLSRARWLVLSAVLLAAAPGSGQTADAGPDTGTAPATSAVDAGDLDADPDFLVDPDAAAEEAVIALPPPPPLPPAREVLARIEELRARIEALRALLVGTLPEKMSLSDLLPFDLANQERVDARRAELTDRMAALRAGTRPIPGLADAGDETVDVLDAGEPEAEVGLPELDAGVLSASPDAGEPEVSVPRPAGPDASLGIPEQVDVVAAVAPGVEATAPAVPIPALVPVPVPMPTVPDAGPTVVAVAIPADAVAEDAVDAVAAEDVVVAAEATVAGPPVVPAVPVVPAEPAATADQMAVLEVLELEVLDVELAILELPLEARRRLVDAQGTRDRIAAELAAASTEAEGALRERIDQTTRMAAAIRVLIAGSLPKDLATSQLFAVNVVDEAAVAQRRSVLETELTARRAQLQALGPEPQPPVVGELAQADLDLAEARLSFLSQTAEQRQAVLAAEEEQRRLAAERQAAAAEQEQAARDQAAATAARDQALEEERQASTEVERVFARERAAAESVRLEQAQRRGALADRKAADVAAENERHTRTYDLLAQLQPTPPSGTRADSAFDRLNGELDRVLAAVEAAYAALDSLKSAPRPRRNLEFLDGVPTSFSDQKAKLLLTYEELEKSAGTLERDERDVAGRRLQGAFDWLRKLWGERERLLPRLSGDRSDTALGFGRDGGEQVGRELRRLRIELRRYLERRPRDVGRLFAALGDWYVLAELALRGLGLLLLAAIVLWIRRRGPGWLEKARAGAERGMRRRPWLQRRTRGLLAAAEAIWNPGLAFAAVLAVPKAVGAAAAGVPEVALALTIVLWITGYRLAVVASERAIAWAATRYGSGIGRDARKQVRRSLVFAGRYVAAAAIALAVMAPLVGRGTLYDWVAFFATLGGWALAIVLIRWWQPAICDRYLVYRPTGRLADRVRATRDKRYGFLVALLAFGLVTAVAGWRAAKRFVLGFEHTRKALAYLFRRQLEKRIGEAVLRPDGVELPADLTEALRDRPAESKSCTMGERFPGLDRLRELAQRWRVGGSVGSALVVGRPGTGRTSWLRAAEATLEGAPVTRFVLSARTLDERGMLDALGEALGAPPAARATVPALGAWLRQGEPRFVVWDDLELLVLRGVGTLRAWQAFSDVVEAAGDRVFWLCSMARFPYEYLTWARRGLGAFRAEFPLAAWTEDEIAKLLRSRTEGAGYEVVYDDLVVEKLEGTEAETQRVNTGQQYLRLIWDYADGSPRVALHCWERSLMPDGEKRLRVRLFRRPDPNVLEALSERDKFLLAAVVWHEALSAEHAALSLRYPEAACRDGFTHLRELGVVAEDEGRMRVTTEWLAPVLRYLDRKHLIEP